MAYWCHCHLLKRPSLFQWIAFAPLSKINWIFSVSISGFSSLFRRSLYLSLHLQNLHYPSYIMSLEIECSDSSHFILFKIVLAILVLLPLHINYSIILSISTPYQKFDRICIKLVYQFRENWHLYYVDSSNPWTWYVSSLSSSISFIKVFYF